MSTRSCEACGRDMVAISLTTPDGPVTMYSCSPCERRVWLIDGQERPIDNVLEQLATTRRVRRQQPPSPSQHACVAPLRGAPRHYSRLLVVRLRGAPQHAWHALQGGRPPVIMATFHDHDRGAAGSS